ncbi:MAG: DoxX family membrane protein [Solirubrobacteraceae bacterium]
MRAAYQRLLHLENHIHHQLVLHSIPALRIALGAVFLGFGVLKYFPGVSPAQNLVEDTAHILFLGLVPNGVALVLIATVECFIGICLLSGRWMRLGMWLLTIELVGILSPAILLPGRLFAGPHHAPTLEGQYVLKDIILVAAGLVIAAATFRGGRLVRGDLPPATPPRDHVALEPEQKLRIVLDGMSMSDQSLVSEMCRRYHISEADFYNWRETSLVGATDALAREAAPPAWPAARR